METLKKLLPVRTNPAPSVPSTPPPPPPPAPTEPSPQTPPEPLPDRRTPITSARSLKQLSIYFLGSACLLASTAITRKAIHRRNLRIVPKFYEPNTNPHEYFSPFQDAIQALNMATMNCVSVGIMALGGAMWTFDIAGLAEARSVLRRRLGYHRIYKSEEDVPSGLVETLERAGEMRVFEEEGEEGGKEGEGEGKDGR